MVASIPVSDCLAHCGDLLGVGGVIGVALRY